MAKSIEIDRKKRLREEPGKGHNRWHPDIAPVIDVEAGEEVALETRDANDLQIHAGTTAKELEKLERTVAHPLTGPVYVKGAEPGDLLEIEYLDIRPERYGWTRFAPGGGFLPDLFDYHFVAHWDITPEYATSPQLPGHDADKVRTIAAERKAVKAA
jgi:formamidase